MTRFLFGLAFDPNCIKSRPTYVTGMLGNGLIYLHGIKQGAFKLPRSLRWRRTHEPFLDANRLSLKTYWRFTRPVFLRRLCPGFRL